MKKLYDKLLYWQKILKFLIASYIRKNFIKYKSIRIKDAKGTNKKGFHADSSCDRNWVGRSVGLQLLYPNPRYSNKGKDKRESQFWPDNQTSNPARTDSGQNDKRFRAVNEQPE